MPAPRRVSLQDVSCFFAHQFQESEPISEALQGGSSVGCRTCGWVDTGPHFGCSRYCTTCSKAPGLLFKRPTFHVLVLGTARASVGMACFRLQPRKHPGLLFPTP